MGTGIGHYIPLVAFIGFPIMCLVSLFGRPLWGLYYLLPFLPYRSMRNHFTEYPLGKSVLTILVVCVIIGALFQGKRLAPSVLYAIWAVVGVYLYFSMWIGAGMGNMPAPLWLQDANFTVWKDYMVVPMVFIAASLAVQDRKAVRNVIIITAISLLFIDRSCIMESRYHTWANFDENKRDMGPLAYGANLTGAYLAQFGLFLWGVLQYMKPIKYKVIGYLLLAATMYSAMYTFSRGAYLAILVGAFILGILKDRKLLVLLGIFLLTWQTLMPTAVTERVTMTENKNGQLESSAEARVILWRESWNKFLHSPVVGNGFASFQYGEHDVADLRDTHNWFVKVMVETGVLGIFLVLILLQQMLAASWRVFRRCTDPLYKGLGLGLVLAFFTSMVANCFGDRWTYLEITGPMWVLIATGLRALQLSSPEPATEPVTRKEPAYGALANAARPIARPIDRPAF